MLLLASSPCHIRHMRTVWKSHISKLTHVLIFPCVCHVVTEMDFLSNLHNSLALAHVVITHHSSTSNYIVLAHHFPTFHQLHSTKNTVPYFWSTLHNWQSRHNSC